MKEPRDPWIYVEYIAESVRFILEYSAHISREQFLDDHQVQDAVIRRFQISVPQKFKDIHPEIPWKEMMAQRDVLVHDYFDISFERLWTTIHSKLPSLGEQIANILKEKPII